MITVSVNSTLPGSLKLAVTGTPDTVGTILRLDGYRDPQYVRNFAGFDGSGIAVVIDCEAPLGRPVTYSLLDAAGNVLATSDPITCPALASGRSLLRSVLKPTVKWMECEPQDEAGVEWATSTTVHRIVGSDTPVVVGEVRQRRSGTMTFLCRSVAEADQLVSIMRDGTPLLLRFDPCAAVQVRDLLFYALTVTEQRWGRRGYRLVSVDYQSTAFVKGDTIEPPAEWTYQHIADQFARYDQLPVTYLDYWDVLLDERRV